MGAMKVLKIEVDATEVEAIFKKFDPDGSGKIDFSELNKLLRQGSSVKLDKKLLPGSAGDIALTSLNKSSEKVMTLFKEWDEDGDGTISKKEFKAAMKALEIEMTG